MNWSISKAKIFSKCQRKWFYYEIMAKKNSKDKDRFEAYILKQLGSIHAWRGNIVDYVIENCLVPEFNKGLIPPFDKIKTLVSELMRKQLEFAKLRKYRNPKLTKKNAGVSYCALREIENSEGLDDVSIKKIKKQVIISLKNLLQSDLMKTLLDPNTFLVAQKNLNFKFKELNIISRPDLIVYFRNKSPLIIDWKVYFHKKENAWMQLGIYAIALTECLLTDPFQNHIDDPTKIRLIEYQLLKNYTNNYKLTNSDISYIKDYIYSSLQEMDILINNKKYNEIDIELFKRTSNLEICKYCSFKTLCWNKKIKYQVNLMKFLNK